MPTKAFKILTKKTKLKEEKNPLADSFLTEKHLLFPGQYAEFSLMSSGRGLGNRRGRGQNHLKDTLLLRVL